MIAVYAMGTGLGHLTRVAAALHTLSVDPAEAVVLTSSPFAADRRVIGSMRVDSVEPDGTIDALDRLRPTELWVDAFPSGLRGELAADRLPGTIQVTRHFARLLRWDEYGPLLGSRPIEYDVVHLLEPLTDAHADRLAMLADDLAPLELRDEPAALPDAVRDALLARHEPRWLVVHAGPADEVDELVAYAEDMATAESVDPSVTIVSPGHERPGAIDRYPAWPLFGLADRIITAAGFNVMRQVAAAGAADRHRVLPFRRRFDDQFERARRARSCTRPA
jgi:hypothetical protein